MLAKKNLAEKKVPKLSTIKLSASLKPPISPKNVIISVEYLLLVVLNELS